MEYSFPDVRFMLDWKKINPTMFGKFNSCIG